MERLNGFCKGVSAGFIIWFIIALMILSGCASSPVAMPYNKIESEYNITTTTILVHWYNSEQELQLSLGHRGIAGFSECELRPDFNTSFCELWLVRPIDANDYYSFDTIGHEFYHALAGGFHD